MAVEIETATLRLQRIVENFLEMTRIESEVLQPQKDWSDFVDVLHLATETLRQEEQIHRLQTEVPDDLPLLRLDARLFAQALGNVLHNAMIYSPDHSLVALHVSLDGGALEVSVRDQGPGFEAGDEERVFDKFYRGRSAPAGGTGLGLAIARGLLRAQGGEIRAQNGPEGGAEFVMSIPVETHPL